MKIAILGFGAEGKSALRFIMSHPTYRAAEVFVLDRNPKTSAGIPTAVAKKIKLRVGKNYLADIASYNLIIRSPGIPFKTPELQTAAKNTSILTSATKIFFEEINRQKPKPLLIGVSGTKGKSTTSTAIYQILKQAGKKVALAGNIGIPMLDIVKTKPTPEIIILELSSFQLQDLQTSPDIAVFVDIFPDHLDSHQSLGEYFKAKSNLTAFQSANQPVFFFADNKNVAKILKHSPAERHPVIPSADTPLKNLDLAAAVCRYLKISEIVIQETNKKFKGLEHRLELVRQIKTKTGTIKFINDSAATNPGSTIAAIRAQEEATILLLGGKDKNLSYAELAKAINKSKVCKIILYGENRQKINSALTQKNIAQKIVSVKNLKSAFSAALKDAPKILAINPKPTELCILFSPASASFDQFNNAKERGQYFKKLVRALNHKHLE